MCSCRGLECALELSARLFVHALQAILGPKDPEHGGDHREHLMVLHQPRVVIAYRGRDEAQLRVVHCREDVVARLQVEEEPRQTKQWACRLVPPPGCPQLEVHLRVQSHLRTAAERQWPLRRQAPQKAATRRSGIQKGNLESRTHNQTPRVGPGSKWTGRQAQSSDVAWTASPSSNSGW